MTRTVSVILNAGSGGGNSDATADEVRRLFMAAGTQPEIALARGGDDLSRHVETALARRPDVIVAGGGDGTVSAVAGALVDTGIPLGVLPLGTLNHFAKDLCIPLDLDGAVAQVMHGRVERVDVGEVNGRVFINNSSLGLYPEIVRLREQQQRQLGRGKWPALLWASLKVLKRYPFLGVRMLVDQEARLRRTPFVFIGNNAYEMEGFDIGERAGLSDGLLSLYVAQRPGRLRLLQLAVRAVLGRLQQARDFDALEATEIVIESGRRHLRVATDGEVTDMTPPLTYKIRPGSLAVMLAADSPVPGGS